MAGTCASLLPSPLLHAAHQNGPARNYFGKERKNKGTMQSKRSFNARHSWHHERRCFDVLRRSGLEQVDIYN